MEKQYYCSFIFDQSIVSVLFTLANVSYFIYIYIYIYMGWGNIIRDQLIVIIVSCFLTRFLADHRTVEKEEHI